MDIKTTLVSSRRRGRPTAETADEVSAQIQRAALRHFLTEGIERASLARIAQEAGVSRQLLYQKYGDKRRLFEATMAQRESGFFASGQIADSPGDDPSPDAVVAYAQSMAAFLLSAERIELTRITFSGLYRFPEIGKVEGQLRERATAGVARYLEALLKDAGVSGVDVMSAARDFRALINGLATPAILGIEPPPPPEERERLVDSVTRRFLRGLGIDASRSPAGKAR